MQFAAATATTGTNRPAIGGPLCVNKRTTNKPQLLVYRIYLYIAVFTLPLRAWSRLMPLLERRQSPDSKMLEVY